MKKRKKINIILPFYQMKRGDRMYISLDSVAICPSEKKDIGLLYINKNPIISPVQFDGFISIAKIGDGFKGEDFDVEFTGTSFYSIHPYSLDESRWLEPVEILLKFISPLNVSDLLDYSEFSLQELMDVFEDTLASINIDYYKDGIQKIFQALPKVAKNDYSFYDMEALYIEKSNIDSILADLNNSKRGKLAQNFYRTIKQIIVETIAESTGYKLVMSVEEIKSELKYLSQNGNENQVRTDELLVLLQEITKKNNPKKGGG